MTIDVLVDTSVWSEVLRRQTPHPTYGAELKKLIFESRIKIIGPIRQELLTGISDFDQFIKLKNRLSAFSDLLLRESHFEYAAELSNTCRKRGIQGSHTDFLICAVSKLENFAIFTTDNDFNNYTKIIGLSFHATTWSEKTSQ